MYIRICNWFSVNPKDNALAVSRYSDRSLLEKRVKKALKNDCYSSRKVCYNTMEDNYTKKETKQ